MGCVCNGKNSYRVPSSEEDLSQLAQPGSKGSPQTWAVRGSGLGSAPRPRPRTGTWSLAEPAGSACKLSQHAAPGT
jgi:hypothetical protein